MTHQSFSAKPLRTLRHPRQVIRILVPWLKRPYLRAVAISLLTSFLLCADLAFAGVAVQYKEGAIHGFLVLSTLQGNAIAQGDMTQIAHGDRITNHLLFHFKDGSLHDETAIFTQAGEFRLLSYHLVQRGPAFPHPTEVWIDMSKGEVTVHSDDGENSNSSKDQTKADHPALPTDVSNGLVLTLLKNIRPGSPEFKVSMVAATPKPRVVKLAISTQGEDQFTVAGSRRKATHFVIKVEIPGPAGLVAEVAGKQPPDTHVWILQGEAPAFVKSEGPMFADGPIWRTEIASPKWPQLSARDSKDHP